MSDPLRTYAELSPIDREIVQLLSVHYVPTSRTALAELCSELRPLGPGDAGLPTYKLANRIRELLAAGVFEEVDKRGIRCAPAIMERATREAVAAGRFAAMLDAIFPRQSTWADNRGRPSNYHLAVRDVRLAFYGGDVAALDAALAVAAKRFPGHVAARHPLMAWSPVNDAEALAGAGPEVSSRVLLAVAAETVRTFEPVAPLVEALQRSLEPSAALDQWVLALHILAGEPETARRVAAGAETPGLLAIRGWLALLDGDVEASVAAYDAGWRALGKTVGKRKAFFSGAGGVAGLFYVLALLRQPGRLEDARGLVVVGRSAAEPAVRPAYEALSAVVDALAGGTPAPPALDEAAGFAGFVAILAGYWLDPGGAAARLPTLRAWLERALQAGHRWLAAEVAEVVARLDDGADAERRLADEVLGSATRPRLADVVRQEAPWERALNALMELTAPAGSAPEPPPRDTRLAWWVEVKRYGIEISPREQKRAASGWTKGRPVALKRLREEAARLDFLTAQDRRVCLAIDAEVESTYYGRYTREFYVLDPDRALPALVGHPAVFRADDPSVSVEVAAAEPALVVRRKRGGLAIELVPAPPRDASTHVVEESPSRLAVYQFTNAHRRIAEVLGKGLTVPAAGSERVARTIAALAPVVGVHSDVAADAADAETVPADLRPHVHLRPYGAGLQLELLVKPLSGGPTFRPGAGGRTVLAEVGGARRQTQRDLAAERRRTDEVLARCPTLNGTPETGGLRIVEDPEASLEALLELSALGDEVVLAWPEGKPIQVEPPASLDRLRLDIRRQGDWFAASAALRVDDELTLEMAQLLELLAANPGRFVPLGDRRFLALTETFRRRLDELRAFGHSAGGRWRFSPLAAPALEALTEGAGEVRTDKAWKDWRARLQAAAALEPALPSTLRTDLRPYQLDGYRWLARLAAWGAGACLADDMGLGKTVQALALLLARAPEGPALVVAPTSVALNWAEEARRFAPTLRVRTLGARDRQSVLDALGPFDVLVTSYGLLQQEAERLAAVQWHTAILDEAQAIKNPTTQRSKAAMELRAAFRLALTGTPIENHLGELWNLFRFLNPGLLGSRERFDERFAHPIERNQDREARERLRKLVQPFILRRTKSQVLDELPARTDITLHVELGAREAALYEAQRQRALEVLAEADPAAPGRPLQILAELTRLRRLCCNPQLVLPGADVPSSKLEAFEELLEELLDNRHKVLVFSQFVDHLSLVRARLDARGVVYQYLDGSTPAAERKRRIDAFQAGAGDVFLISLKAGGTGINLTAADYVIHLDPWWNPAVEDQASDRAHRIGQQRPVTVYRLVTQGTIEESIVALHHRKRDLADSLLEGTDAAARLSGEALLALIRG